MQAYHAGNVHKIPQTSVPIPKKEWNNVLVLELVVTIS